MIRRSKNKDIKSLIKLLEQLTFVGDPVNVNETIYDNIYVYQIDNEIIGCCTLLVEPKIIHNGSKVGHIEDLVVSKEHRGKGIGKELLKYCIDIAKKHGCYKVILDCDESNINFYNKCGFRQKGVCMRLDTC